MTANEIFALGMIYLLAYGLGCLIAKTRGIFNIIILVTIVWSFASTMSFESLTNINLLLLPIAPVFLVILPSLIKISSNYDINYQLAKLLRIIFFPFIVAYKLFNMLFSSIFTHIISNITEKRRMRNIIKSAEREKSKANEEKKYIVSKIRKIFSQAETAEEFELLLTNSFLAIENGSGVLYLVETKSNNSYNLYDLGILDDYFVFCKRINANENNIEWWTILNVSKNASEEEIKTAYHKLCFQYHPDYNKSASHDDFLKIQAAYNVALNACKKGRGIYAKFIFTDLLSRRYFG